MTKKPKRFTSMHEVVEIHNFLSPIIEAEGETDGKKSCRYLQGYNDGRAAQEMNVGRSGAEITTRMIAGVRAKMFGNLQYTGERGTKLGDLQIYVNKVVDRLNDNTARTDRLENTVEALIVWMDQRDHPTAAILRQKFTPNGE